MTLASPHGNTPAVTVIATAYNTADFLAQAVESVLSQTYRELELLVVDDASTDSTWPLVEQLAQTDDRIRIFRHPTNRGAGEARNTALRHARGKYVAFLDTDDVWEREFLERMCSELDLQDDSCAGVFCAYRNISEDGAPLGVGPTLGPGSYDLLRMMEGICPPGNGSTLLVRRSCFDEVGEFLTMEVGQDAEMWLRMVGESSRSHFQYLPSYLVRYRKREASLSKRSHHARQESFDYRIETYLPMIPSHSRWRVYSAFARYSEFAGPGLDPWRKAMSRKALMTGGLRGATMQERRELIEMALWGVRRWGRRDLTRWLRERGRSAFRRGQDRMS